MTKHKHTLWSKTTPYGPYYCDRDDWTKCEDHKHLSLTISSHIINAENLGLKDNDNSNHISASEYQKIADSEKNTEPKVKEVRWIVDPRDVKASLEKAEKLVKRANKKGLDGGLKVYLDESSGKPEIVVTGEPYKTNGWTFVASIEHLPNGEAIVKKSPYYNGPDVEQEFLEGNMCQHCNVKKQRRVQVVIEDEEGHRIILGSTCVKDFLGWNYSPVYTLDAEEIRDEITGGKETFHEPIKNVLAIALAVKDLYGFQSASGDSESLSTKTRVQNFLHMPERYKDKDVEEQLKSKDYDAEAKALITMVEEDTANADNDYLRNMKAAFTGGEAYSSTVGLIVSSILMAEKKKAKAAKEETKASLTNALYAPVGAKIELEVQCVDQRDFETAYGFTTLYTFVGDSHRFKWFSTSNHSLETGEKYVLKGTVKQENDYNGDISTVLTRCKIS